ncbi:MAG: choice-of-anchor D domain-containing protein [Candidatus Latescibacterota bacterium]
MTAKNVAKWGGVSWSPLGSGVRWANGSTDRVFAAGADSSGALFCGGDFDRAGYQTSRRFARWYQPAEGGPDISITPGLLVDSLLAGEMETHAIAISNSGGIDLTWRMAIGRDLAGNLNGVRIMWERAHGQESTTNFTTIVDSLTAGGATVTEGLDALTPELLKDFDIYWTADMTSAWSPADISVLSDWVLNGGKLLLGADNQPTLGAFNSLFSGMRAGIEYSSTAITSFYATYIFPHSTTMGVDNLYYSSSNARLSNVQEPAGILVNHPTGGSLGAYAALGRGRLVALADETVSNQDISGIDADNLLFGCNAIEWLASGVDWSIAEPAWGILPAGESSEVVITLDASELNDGNYSAEIQAYSNDFATPVFSIPIYLHVTGITDIAVSDTTLDFGKVIIETSFLDTLMVVNVGTDTLTVSEISTDHMDFSVEPASLNLVPGDSLPVAVTFTPSSLGILSGTLTIISDDPDEDTLLVTLQGEGVEPAAIDVTPDSLSEALYTGQVSTQNLTIQNAGGSPLHWSWSLFGLDGVRVMFARSNGQASSANYSEFIDSLSARGAIVTEEFSPIDSLLLSEYDILWTRDMLVGWSPQERSAIEQWVLNGGCLLIEADQYPTIGTCNSLLSSLGAGIQYSSATTFSGFTDDIILHDTTIDVDSLYFIAAHAKLSQVISPAGRLVRYPDGSAAAAYSQAGSGRIITLAEEMFPNYELAGVDSDNHLFGHQIFRWLVGNSYWLSAAPNAGTVPPQEQSDLIVKFDARYLDGGTYLADLNITSNAVNDSIVTVPISLRVTPVSDIMLSDLILSYSSIFLGQSVGKTLTIFNLGNDTLKVDRLSIDTPGFQVDTTLFNISPDENHDLSVIFAPLVEGPIAGTLTIESNDIDEGIVTVSLEGTGMAPPDIVVLPDSLSEALLPDEATMRTVTISNSGASDLHFNIYAAGLADSVPSAAQHKARQSQIASPQPSLPRGKRVGPVLNAEPQRGQELKAHETCQAQTIFAPQSSPALAPTTPFVLETFEDGNYDGWGDGGGSSSKEVTAGTAGNGTKFSYHESNSASGHYNGIYRMLASTQPHYIGFWMRSADTATFDSYTVLRDSEGREAIWFFANANGTFYVNVDVGGSASYEYNSDTWYHIEFTDIDYVDKTFDYHVNHELMQENISFRNADLVDNLHRLDLYNYSAGSETWWDEIYITDWTPLAWLAAAPRSDIVSPGSSSQVTLFFDAGGLDTGSYEGYLKIQSNVPGKSLISVPVHLEVDSLLMRVLTFPLSEGWNLISWNVDTQTDSIHSLLSSIMGNVIVAHGFEGGGRTFDPAIPAGFNTLAAVSHQDGCWIKMSDADSLLIEGQAVLPQQAIPLDAGYNLISYLPSLRDSVMHALASVMDNTDLVLGFDGTILTYDPAIDPNLNTLHFMEPLSAYWLKAATEDTLVYAKFSSIPPQTAASDKLRAVSYAPSALTPTTEWISVWGDSVEWAGDLADSGTVITALDEDSVVCGICNMTESGRFGCLSIYRDDPYTVTDEGANPGEVVRLYFNNVPHSKYIIWTENGAVVDFDEITTGSENESPLIPSSYDLGQNFPNPFNPRTTILYDLPEATPVYLSIYNVKGELVRRLVNCWQPAGRYKTHWDARNDKGQRVSSGVYFYQYTTKNFKRTKKMVILK